ncbi:hypothetical protein GCM10009105_25340 [Dokdonella soli]|uniref:Methyltransferase, TIGR04325 family n=2 Tax=Dokdonella soli TaxID=529810 RepID=A0ABN1INW9_9GAMM
MPRFLVEHVGQRRFFAARGWQNLHWGVFDSFASAQTFAARFGADTRYRTDHEVGLQQHLTIKSHDYPILYWLTRLLPTLGDGRFIDFGGSVGASYYAYRDRLPLPRGMVWTVCELPEVVALGRLFAEKRAAPALSFTDRVEVLDGAELLFTAGCLQFVEQPLAAILGALDRMPRHVLINRLCLTGGTPYVTLHNTGFSVSPCRVDSIAAFVASLVNLGYVLEDSWHCLESSLYVPLHPECTLQHFLGFYFRDA